MLVEKFSIVIPLWELFQFKTFQVYFQIAHAAIFLRTLDLMEFVRESTCSSLLLKTPDCWLRGVI